MLNRFVEFKLGVNDYTELLVELRRLRSVCCSKEEQREICDSGTVSVLIRILENLTVGASYDENALLSLRVGLQCLVNVVVNNAYTQKFVWSNHSTSIKKWCCLEDDKARNFLYALYHSILVENVRLIEELLDDRQQMLYAIASSMKGTEFSQFLLERCIESGGFKIMYNSLGIGASEERIYLLELLDSVVTKNFKYLNEIDFISLHFKRKSDAILKTKPEYVEKVDLKEVSCLLEVLGHASTIENYRTVLQKDKSLVINCMYLLIGMHKAVRDREEISKQSELNALNEMMANMSTDVRPSPEFNFKGNLIRLIGNLAYKNKEVQDMCRELEALHVILDCCTIDPKNPFIREWSIFAIKCICEENLHNQELISGISQINVKTLPPDRIIEFT
ncbi:ataxin-10 [Cimex lectularius]|uniref:Ataxin-10 n=1 Tax=Cimex lectularius TaxID=79782 RepID=A0A8I6TDK2_CIMLE|nr:ataxin-10 [Cimex lectularius]